MGYGTARIQKILNYPLALIIDDYTTANITYMGYAECGSAITDAIWRIKVIDETGNFPIFKFADGNSKFDNIWNDRTTLSYS